MLNVEFRMFVFQAPCEVSEWTEWSACAAACGSGIVTRRRYVLNPAFAARSCPDLTMSKQCESTRNCCKKMFSI